MPISIPTAAPDTASASLASLSTQPGDPTPSATGPAGGTGSTGKKGHRGQASVDFAQALTSANANTGSTTATPKHAAGKAIAEAASSGSPVTAKKTAEPLAAVATTPATPIPPAPAIPVLPSWLGTVSSPLVAQNPTAAIAGDEEGQSTALLGGSPTTSVIAAWQAGQAGTMPANASTKPLKAAGKGGEGVDQALTAPAAKADDEAKKPGNAEPTAAVELAQETAGAAIPVPGSTPGKPVQGVVFSVPEKIAVIADRSGSSGKNSGSFSDKHSQDSINKQVASDVNMVGTSSAELAAAMTPDTHFRLPIDPTQSVDATSLPKSVVAVAATVGAAHLTATGASEQFAIPSSAEGAVQTVMHVVDLQSASGLTSAPAVSLHFRIGDNNLSVRVEMQNGTVHTQFTTDSNDLRSAITHEWKSVPDAVSGKAIHFSDPVFSSSGEGSGKGSLARDGRENGQGRYASAEDMAYVTGRSLGQSATTTMPETVESAESSADSALSNHLLTFA